ncbi:hypothetical protein CMV_020486 [Castanea mollissima]|uniref:Uncharacterized protein n=1 Tax=Castanea mollissima TaxID=60419 RepID=A0A8J4VMM8_9ROSI|nr:hypothetical protein CMV_020486 [Castanea mollissima]
MINFLVFDFFYLILDTKNHFCSIVLDGALMWLSYILRGNNLSSACTAAFITLELFISKFMEKMVLTSKGGAQVFVSRIPPSVTDDDFHRNQDQINGSCNAGQQR